MLGQRRRQWANIGQTLARYVVFAGGQLSTPTTVIYLCINHGDQRVFFQFEMIIRVLVSMVSSFPFNRIPMLWVYSHYKYFALTTRGSTSESDVYCRQILTSRL